MTSVYRILTHNVTTVIHCKVKIVPLLHGEAQMKVVKGLDYNTKYLSTSTQVLFPNAFYSHIILHIQHNDVNSPQMPLVYKSGLPSSTTRAHNRPYTAYTSWIQTLLIIHHSISTHLYFSIMTVLYLIDFIIRNYMLHLVKNVQTQKYKTTLLVLRYRYPKPQRHALLDCLAYCLLAWWPHKVVNVTHVDVALPPSNVGSIEQYGLRNLLDWDAEGMDAPRLDSEFIFFSLVTYYLFFHKIKCIKVEVMNCYHKTIRSTYGTM